MVGYTSEGRFTLQIGNESSGPTREDWKSQSMDEYLEVKIDGGSQHTAMAAESLSPGSGRRWSEKA